MPAIRKFGTSLHNIPKKNGPQKVSPTVQAASRKSAAKLEQRVERPVVSDVEVTPEVDSLDISIENIQVGSGSLESACSYTRDFLLQFSNLPVDPIEGLMPEITRGYINPNPPAPFVRRNPATERKAPRPICPSSVKKGLSADAAPFFSPSKNLLNNHVKGCATEPAFSRVNTTERAELATIAKTMNFDEPSDNTTAASDNATTAVKETPKKKSKARETDAKRLAARQKQLDIGMSTSGYRAWLEQVPAAKRSTTGPRIPDVFQVCSKRSWDGQVRKWRRELHAYDPEGTPLPDNLEDELDELNEC